jgi:hypothetical protein
MMDELEAVLCGLAEEIREADHHIAGLQALLQQIEAEPACFSDNERIATSERIDAETRERAHCLELLREKVEVYESRVLELSHRIDVRRRIIDENPASLKASPELLSVFVDQHTSIVAELEAARSFLLER